MIKIFTAFLIIFFASFRAFSQEGDVFFYQSLAWFLDNKTLISGALNSYDQKTDQYETGIYLVNTNPFNLQKISGDIKQPSYPDWSKTGTQVAFSAHQNNSKDTNLFTAEPDGKGLTQLTNETGQNTAPAFSPDGKKIAFMSTRGVDKNFQIYVINSDGTDIKQLTTDKAYSFCNPRWSKDGKKIVYYSDKSDGKDQIWIMNANGSNQNMLTNNIGHNIFPDFSPDGKLIIFSSSNRDDGKASYIEGSYLYTMNTDGSNVKPLANIKSFFARFSLDGKRIAFISGSFPKSSIYLANVDGSNQILLTTMK